MSFLTELERSIKWKESLGLSLILRFLEAGSPFQTEVGVRANGWLFCLSDLQVEPQFLSLSSRREVFFINLFKLNLNITSFATKDRYLKHLRDIHSEN